MTALDNVVCLVVCVDDVIVLYVVQSIGEVCCVFFFQAEDGIRDLVRSRGLGDVYKRQQYYLIVKLSLKSSYHLDSAC